MVHSGINRLHSVTVAVGSSVRHLSSCLPATSGSAFEAGLVCRGRGSDPGALEHSRCSLARRQQNMQKARRWHCKPHGFGWSGHLGCAPMHGLTVLRAPAPEEAQIGTAVESIIKEARSVSPSDSGKCADAQALA